MDILIILFLTPFGIACLAALSYLARYLTGFDIFGRICRVMLSAAVFVVCVFYAVLLLTLIFDFRR